MAEGPWICSRCGTATNADNCPSCLNARPYSTYSNNAPGSYLGITQGPKGWTGVSRGWAIGLAIFIFTPLISFVARMVIDLFRH